MFVVASQKPLPNLRRIRREIETHRIERIKKAHADIKKIAQEELQFFKDLFPKTDVEEKNNDK